MENPSPFKLIAGHVALDFANTLDSRYQRDRTVDLIATYPEFLRFCRESGFITLQEAATLLRLKRGAEAALRQAGALREALEHIFVAVNAGTSPPETDLKILSESVREALPHRELRENGNKVEWQWVGLEEQASGPIWKIAEAAVSLLLSDDLELVRRCGSETCRWLFLDTSKNHSRRWCDMKLCGNRVKARNYYRKGRQEVRGKLI